MAAEAHGYPDFLPGRPGAPFVDPTDGAGAVVLPFPGPTDPLGVRRPHERFTWTEFVDAVPAVPVSVEDMVDDDRDAIRLPNVVVAVSASPASNPRVRRAAQQLYTSVYLKEGYVEEGELDDSGLYIDEYDKRSTYFLAENGRKVTTIRQIRATKRGGILSLPTTQHFALDADVIAEVAGVDSLAGLKAREMVEISGLASDRKEDGVPGGFDATLSIYSSMLRTAVEQGHRLWIQNTTPEVIAQLSALIGKEHVRQIGEPEMYMGSVTTPIAINPQAVVKLLLGSSNPEFDFHKAYLKEAFRGLDARETPADIRQLLTANDIEHTEPSTGYQIVRSPKVIAAAGLVAYAVARAIPLSGLDEFTGEAAIFAGIDIATVAPYVWGLGKMYDRNASTGMKLLGAAVALPSLIAPYAYMYAEGQGYPDYVNAFVAALISGAIIKDIVSRTRLARREAEIREALAAPKPQIQLAH